MGDLRADTTRLRHALAEAGDLLSPTLRSDLATLLDRVDQRLGHLGDSIVVALAGGTGSGKSSLLNALAGTRVVEAGVLRPTTDHPVAWAPRGAEPGLWQLLAELGVTDHRLHDDDTDLVLIDLPDIDSVRPEHRQMVDRLVPRVDAVIWVLDPTKYNDALVHQDYLRPLRDYEEQFLVVMNQVDRLAEDELRDVLADLRATLDRSGLTTVPVVATAADPAAGAPRGLDELRAEIDDRFRRKLASQAKLRVDVDRVTAGLREVAAVDVGLPDRDDAFGQAADHIARGIIDDAEIGRAGDLGAATANRAASGPVGAVSRAVRGTRMARALGLRNDELLDASLLPSTSRPMSRIGPAVVLQDWVTDVTTTIGPPLDRRVRTTVGDLDGVVRAASAEARAAIDVDLAVTPRAWWTLVGLLRTLALVAVGVLAVMVWSDPGLLAPGRVPVPALGVVVAVLLWVGLGRLVRASGRAAGEVAALAHRDVLRRIARESLDFRLGRPVDDVLATCRRLRALLDDAPEVSRSGPGAA